MTSQQVQQIGKNETNEHQSNHPNQGEATPQIQQLIIENSSDSNLKERKDKSASFSSNDSNQGSGIENDHRYAIIKQSDVTYQPIYSMPSDRLMKTELQKIISSERKSLNQFNEEDQRVLNEVYYGEEAEKPISSEAYSTLIKNSIKNCFHNGEGVENLESQFKEFLKVLEEIKLKDISVLDNNFFKKIILLAQLDNPKKSVKVTILFQQLFNDNLVLRQILNLREHQRLVVDVVNSFFNLIEKFRQTRIEMEMRVAFSSFSRGLQAQGISQELSAIIQNQTGKKYIDSIELNQEQKELLELVRHYAKFKEIAPKQESLKYITLLLGKCESIVEQYKVFVYHMQSVFVDFGVVTYQNKDDKIAFFNQVLDVIDRYIFPIEFLINIDTHKVQGTRSFSLKSLKFIIKEFPKIFTLISGFLNSILLLPNEIQLNLRALFIIRRMYYFFFDDLQIRELLEGPIVVVLSNIATYARDLIQQKEPTLFLHKIMDDKQTLPSLKEKLNQNESVQTLTTNKVQILHVFAFLMSYQKYFSVKAKSYPLDIDVQYNFNTLNFQVNYPLFKNIEAGQFFYFNILISKPESIIYWSFKTINYDIKFGLFKMETISNELSSIEQYSTDKQIKTIFKLQIANSHRDIVMAYSLVSQPGFYRIIFDNTYSYWRSKELFYTIQVLEP